MDKYVMGLDFGTDSVRALVVDARTGEEAGTAVSYYKRWSNNAYCDKLRNRFRQHPSDYIESMEEVIKATISQAGHKVADNIVAISVDTTGSTPVAVDSSGTPLSLHPDFASNPNAMFVLWKDHTSVKEADEINALATSWGGENYTKYEGGIYSSEWFWAKILHILRQDEAVRKAAYSWVEHCDWIPALLTGVRNVHDIKRSRCAAGHKAMWHPDWGGLPGEPFLCKLDPLLAGLRDRLYTDTYTADMVFGNISEEWARRLGLPQQVKVGVGAFDAHLGAVGGEIKAYHLSKVMGTSTCDMVVAPREDFGNKLVRGIAGQVDGSIIPGMIGLEAGQSGFGDVYAWFRDLLLWPAKDLLPSLKEIPEGIRPRIAESMSASIMDRLSKAAEETDPEISGVIAVDWFNGRRTPDANHSLRGAIAGINLGINAPAVFRALVEATAFGSKRIIDRFTEEGVRIDGVIALGGIPKKSKFVMQVVTDVLNMPIEVARHEQTCALGSAMAASVVAGIHPDFATAQQKMGHGFEKTYTPRPEFAKKYVKLYNRYCALGEMIEQISK